MQIKLALLFFLALASCASKPPCKGLTHSCNNGDGAACFELGQAVFGTLGSNNTDPEKTKDMAAKWMLKGCNLGHQKSCTEHSNFKKYLDNGRN